MTLLWIYNLPLIPQAGGTERITWLVAKGLSQLGHRCLGMLVIDQSTLTMTYDGRRVDNLYEFLRTNAVDVVINQIAYERWLLEAFLDAGGDRWRREGGRVVSCLHFDPRPASALYFLRTLGLTTLRHRLNLAKNFLLYPYYRHRQFSRLGETYNWVYDHSDCYVALSERHFPFFKRVTRRRDYSRLVAINNPLTFDDIASEAILDEKRKVVLVCSRMDEYYKRLSIVLRAWRDLQSRPEAADWCLKIVGTGPSLDDYRRWADSHSLRRVYFEGRRDPEPYYREASIFLLTSVNEGWGMTLTESLQRGVVPVVMNTSAVYADIIDHGVNGLLTPANSLKAFTSAIATLMADPDRRRTMPRAALASASRFTLAATMPRWQRLLASL